MIKNLRSCKVGRFRGIKNPVQDLHYFKLRKIGFVESKFSSF
jgi:hypothetical protein